MGKTLLTVGSLKGAVCILKAIGNNYKIGSYGIMHTVQGAVLSSFLETLFSSSFSQFWHESLACSLCWALLFSGPQTSHISNKLHLFCKTCSFSPNFACSETHASSPAKAFPPGGSQPSKLLGSSPPHKPLAMLVRERKNHVSPKRETQFLFLCLGLPPISTETKLFHRAPQDLLLTSVPRASLSQLTDGAFPNLLPH